MWNLYPKKPPRRSMVAVVTLHLPLLHLLMLMTMVFDSCGGSEEIWPLDRPDGMPSIQSLEVMCGKDHMDVHLSFSQPFEGIVSSKGQHGDPRCVYVPPSTGQTFFSFRIAYTRCGTKPDLHGQFYENTVVVQYDKDLLEVWDEAKRLRCEWFNDYEKTASKPPMVIADLDVVQLDFRGDNVDCWMEIQHGKGPWAPPVSGIVPLGSTLTLVVAINDYRGEFDMRVKSCVASDGGAHIIQLSDEYGCVLRPKMISRFLKAKGADDRASVITYAFFHAFKFPDALSVHIKCKVEICRHGCLDHCQLQPHQHYILERKDDVLEPHGIPDPEGTIYDDIIQEGEGGAAIDGNVPAPLKMQQQEAGSSDEFSEEQYPVADADITALPNKDRFPHGPRTFEDELPAPSPRSMSTKDDHVSEDDQSANINRSSSSSMNATTRRKRRSVVVSDRKVRSTDVGVSGLYEVISEADLAFSPDTKVDAVTVFQGRISEEVVYGICMPVPGFSILFVLVAVSAVVSALVAGSLLYRYQLQKEQLPQQHHHHHHHHRQVNDITMGSFTSWLLRMRSVAAISTTTTPTTTTAAAAGDGGMSSSTSTCNGKTTEVHE